MPFKVSLIATISCLLILRAGAQDKLDVKYGKVSADDLQRNYTIDTSAAAVVLFDIASSEIEADADWFQLVFKRHCRIKILNKNGYDASNVSIPVYVDGMKEERVSNLKGATYNLVNGAVVSTSLESKSVFTDKLDKKHSVKKFTLPNVKEGAIIEFSYTITSDFLFNLQPWEFQSKDYPTMWSEYSVAIPSWLEYITLRRGYEREHVPNNPKTNMRSFNFRIDGGAGQANERATYTIPVTTHRWVYKDLPMLKEEDFTTSIDNHLTAIRFQQSAIRIPERPVHPVLSTWPKLYEDYMKEEALGACLKANNNYLSDKVDELVKGAGSNMEKAKRIYAFVRDNYTCTAHSALSMQTSLRNVYTRKNGNVTELNMLLTAMLNKADLEAYPMILSTRANGTVYAFYPIIDMFNYTICAFRDGEQYHYLDASYPYLGFGKLPVSVYNGHARILNAGVEPMALNADSVRERKMTTVMITPDDNGHMKAMWRQTPTYFESCAMRAMIKESGEESYFKKTAKSFPGEVTLEHAKISNLTEMELPLSVEYEFAAQEDAKADVLYFNPMFSEAYKSNPFKSADRTYPVEMPCVMDESYVLSIMAPEGYVVDELPKSVRVKYGDDEGLFEYLTAEIPTGVQMRCRIKLNRATFEPDEYDELRGFFDMIVKKQAEQIVLKKKKSS